jgi:hypothetical protein
MDPDDNLAVIESEDDGSETLTEGQEALTGKPEAETAEELVVSIGDEPTPKEDEEFKGPAPDWVKDLRRERKEDKRLIRELQEKLKTPVIVPAVIEVGKRPTLAECQYDEELHEKQVDEWLKRKAEAETQERKKVEATQEAEAAFRKTQEGYAKAAAELKKRVPSFDDAESSIKDAFSPAQQGMLLDLSKTAEEAALLTVAIGSNAKLLKDLSSIGNPVKFVSEVARIAAQVKTAPRKAPIPERQVRGNASVPGAVDSQLKRLEEEADRTGDRTKVAHYRRQQLLKQREQR